MDTTELTDDGLVDLSRCTRISREADLTKVSDARLAVSLHPGNPAAIAEAKRRGWDLSGLRPRA